jgi:hypothetical protein
MASPLSVRLSDGSKLDLSVPDLDSTSVAALKTLISEALADKPAPASLKIVFKGRILKDEDLLSVAGEAWGATLGRRRCARLALLLARSL